MTTDLEQYSQTPRVLEDLSPMPFGRYKGMRMQDVPANYLHWFYTTSDNKNPASKAVIQYIEKNIVALKQEHPDGIWTPPRR